MSSERIAIQDGRKPGWYWASNEVIDAYGAEMGPYGIAVYHALCRHANPEAQAWPSYMTLATETGIGRAKVIATMKHLVELELVSKKTRTDEAGDPTSNLYTILEVGGSIPRELGSIPQELGVVHGDNQGGIPRRPEQDSLNNTHLKKEEGTCFSETLRSQKAQGLSEERARLQEKDPEGRYLARNPGDKCGECGQFLRSCICPEENA